MAQIKVIQVQCTGNGNVRKTITCEWAGDWSGERELNGNMHFREKEKAREMQADPCTRTHTHTYICLYVCINM